MAINSPKGLRLLYDQIEQHLRSLEALKQDINQEVFVSIITAKLPKDVLLQLEIQKGARNKWTVCNLREFLNDYVSATEKCEQPSAGIAENRNVLSKSMRTSTEALMAGSKTYIRRKEGNRAFGSCRYCNEGHWNDECTKYSTAEARKRRIKGSCFICLKQGHRSEDCTLKKS